MDFIHLNLEVNLGLAFWIFMQWMTASFFLRYFSRLYPQDDLVFQKMHVYTLPPLPLPVPSRNWEMIQLIKMFFKKLSSYLFHKLQYHLHASNLITLFFCQNAASEPFEPSPFMPKEMDDDDDDGVITENQQGLVDNRSSAFTNEKENTVVGARESNVAKIKVVVC